RETRSRGRAGDNRSRTARPSRCASGSSPTSTCSGDGSTPRSAARSLETLLERGPHGRELIEERPALHFESLAPEPHARLETQNGKAREGDALPEAMAAGERQIRRENGGAHERPVIAAVRVALGQQPAHRCAHEADRGRAEVEASEGALIPPVADHQRGGG